MKNPEKQYKINDPAVLARFGLDSYATMIQVAIDTQFEEGSLVGTKLTVTILRDTDAKFDSSVFGHPLKVICTWLIKHQQKIRVISHFFVFEDGSQAKALVYGPDCTLEDSPPEVIQALATEIVSRFTTKSGP